MDSQSPSGEGPWLRALNRDSSTAGRLLIMVAKTERVRGMELVRVDKTDDTTRTLSDSVYSLRALAALRKIRRGLLVLPEKRLVRGHLMKEGAVCLLGAGIVEADRKLGYDMSESLEDASSYIHAMKAQGVTEGQAINWLAMELLNCSDAFATLIQAKNDREWQRCTPEQRYERALDWVEDQIVMTEVRLESRRAERGKAEA